MRHLKFISAPLKAKHFIGQLWQLMTASNVGARTQAWQTKWVVFKIPGFVCKRFLPFFPTPPGSFTCAIFRAVFDSCSSFFVPKPHRNDCYAGYISGWQHPVRKATQNFLDGYRTDKQGTQSSTTRPPKIWKQKPQRVQVKQAFWWANPKNPLDEDEKSPSGMSIMKQ